MLISKLLSSVLLLIFLELFSQANEIDYLKMQGSIHCHIFNDKNDSISEQKILELQDENGFPLWFGREFHKVVCLTGQCRMIYIWLFWDAVGNYLAFQTNELKPLTKTDHVLFKLEDYYKLHLILSDSISVLRNLKQEDMITKSKSIVSKQQVDAVSGATQPFLQEYLVRNAAYTCYTLWHTVYGNTRTEIQRLLEQRADSMYLNMLFKEEKSGYSSWAIDFIKNHPKYYSLFDMQIIQLIKSKNETLSQKALNYFDNKQLLMPKIQKELVVIFDEISYQRQLELIWKLWAVKCIDDQVVLKLLQLFDEGHINESLLSYVYKIISVDNLANPLIKKKLKNFFENKNQYVKNITTNLLQKSKSKKKTILIKFL